MECRSVKINDLVVFTQEEKYLGKKTIKGLVLKNDLKSEKIAIKTEYDFFVINYDQADEVDLVNIGVSKFETIYKPAMIGATVIACTVFGVWALLGSIISGIIQMTALGFGGGMAFILAKNFKKIKNFQIKKNVTILEPIKEKNTAEFVGVSQVENSKLKLLKNELK